jgi:tetratricopeptide (TPR) repeat protein
MARASLWLPPTLILLTWLSGCASVAPLGSMLPPGGPSRVELLDTPFFPQEDHQCGPSALATVLEASGSPARPEQLVAEVYLPGREGSLQQELLAATRRRGRLAYVLSGEADALLAEVQAGRPVLVLQNLGVDAYPIWHYAVLIGFDAQRNDVILRSGRQQRLLMSWSRFEGSWRRGGQWAMTVLPPGTLPARPSLPAYLDACAGLEAAGMLDAAAAAYAAASQRWPRSSLVELGTGNVAYARGDLRGAVAAYQRGIDLSPSDAALRNNLAQALLDSGCVGRARVQARQAAELARGTLLETDVRETLESVEAAAASRGPSASCPDAAQGDGDAQPLSLPHEPAARTRDR